MKKRLLSAVLAMAMVLTLLPMSVFAAPAASAAGDGKETATYIAKNGTYGETVITGAPGWYAQVKGTDDEKNKTYYIEITQGFIISGKYYGGTTLPMKQDKDGNDTTTPLSTTFTSIGNVTAAMGDATSVTADVYSGSLTITGNKLTSITVRDTKQDGSKSEVSLPSGWPTVDDKAFTLSLTNVDSNDDISVSGMTAAVAGRITLDNSSLGDITLDGTVGTKSAAQTVELKNGSESGAIAVTGGTSSNKITVANSEATTISMTSPGGSIEVSGQSKTGNITVSSNATEAKAVAVPSVRVTGGEVGDITRDTDRSTSANSITVSGGRTSAKAISTANGSVTVTSAKTTTIAVTDGSVTVNGPTANTGVITLGNGGAGKASIKVTGSNNKIAGITNTAATLTVDLPADPTNNYGTILDAQNKYNGHNVKGGTFAAKVPAGWLANKGADALVFELSANSEFTYYNGSQLGTALTAQNLAAGNTLTYVGSGGTPAQTITFKNGKDAAGNDVVWGVLKSDGYTPIILPTQVAGVTVNSWFDGVTTYPAGSNYTTPAGTETSVELNAQEMSANASKLLNATAHSTTVDKSVYVSLSGTVITVSGGVSTGNQSGGGIPVTINLYTDVDDTPVPVDVVYNPTSGAVTFAAGQTLGKGMTLEASGYSGLDTLRLSNGTKYTLNGSAIKVLAGDLEIDSSSTEVVVTARASGLNNEQNKALADDLGTSAAFDWSGSPLMAQAVNAAAATISESQLTSWVTKALQTAWQAKNTGKVPDNVASVVGGFDQVSLIPYLAVNVTAYNENGTMTATLVPSYRVVVKVGSANALYKEVFKNTSNGDADGNYIVQTGRALGSLAGELGQIDVTLNLNATLGGAYMHQDSTYVYEGTSGTFEITHGSTNGLGTVVLNTTAPLVTMEDKDGNDIGAYDVLQAAVNDAEEGDVITVGLGYKGSTSISVTGVARTFTIKTEGSHNITSNASGATVTPDKTGKTFTVQLTRDTAAPGQNIVVASVTGGVASVSANPATAGQTVTVTLTPATGYVSNGVTVKTNAGTTVSVSGNGNVYTFVMPANAATVTVTPSFRVTDNKVTINVSPTNSGTATIYTGSTDGKVDQGGTAIVTVKPNSGYRTMDITLRADNGRTVSSTRQSEDVWNITVPSGATSVTVTPSFDRDNNTPFVDVKYADWASTYVSWFYNKGYTTGKDSMFTFKPTDNVTRQELVSFLWKANGSVKMTNYANPFTDVYTSDWAYDAILWAAANGLVDTSSRTFGKTVAATRAEVVTVLYKYAGSQPVSSQNGFVDVSANASYAKAVTWAELTGVTNGKDNRNTFKPNDLITRQEVAKMIYVAET
ncbi:MAG: hypothetical protein HDT38_03585 [Clostridiales bacterium]|nr:hypothetical protein [Clostridiales bacterium]